MPISTTWHPMKRSSWWTLPGRFQRRSGTDRRLLLEAFCLLGLARLTILTVPFRFIAPRLREVNAESPSRGEKPAPPIGSIAWALQSVARHTPWQSKCLAQAMAGTFMLRRRRIPRTLYLGLAKDEGGTLSAHAWLGCGDTILTGGLGHEAFTVVATFARSGP